MDCGLDVVVGAAFRGGDSCFTLSFLTLAKAAEIALAFSFAAAARSAFVVPGLFEADISDEKELDLTGGAVAGLAFAAVEVLVEPFDLMSLAFSVFLAASAARLRSAFCNASGFDDGLTKGFFATDCPTTSPSRLRLTPAANSTLGPGEPGPEFFFLALAADALSITL